MRGFSGIRFLSLVLLGIFLGSCDSKPSVTRDKVQEAWDDYNNPALLDSGAVVVFSQLPNSGLVSKLPWADIYWPSHLGGIALRWKNGFETPFSAKRPTEEQVAAMSESELAALSPAEKYDIFMGRFDFPTVQSELLRTHPAMPTWYGLCHGWASATLNFEEPGAITLKGSSGVKIPFASGDVKALLAYAQGVVYMPTVRALGQRCEADLTTQPHMRNTAACRDTNAGSFHLILANYVGRNGQKVIADLTRGSEVWNFPIYGFTSRELVRRGPSPGSAPQAVSEVVVETEVEFIVELETPNFDPLADSRAVAAEKVIYQYAVELDALGRVVGGSWLTEDRPDFLWIQERADFRGYYGGIESIYENSLRGVGFDPLPILTPTPTPVPIPEPTPVAVVPAPSVPPSLDPSQPIGPVLTQPIPVPTPPVDAGVGPNPVVPQPSVPSMPLGSLLNCPIGSQVVSRGAIILCSAGERAFAPVTALMHEICLKSGATGCHDPLWNIDLYVGMRGHSACPVGAVWSERVSACVENNLVLGPFSQDFTRGCMAQGFGNICVAMKIDLTYFDIVMSRK
jgi:hypothetical protein